MKKEIENLFELLEDTKFPLCKSRTNVGEEEAFAIGEVNHFIYLCEILQAYSKIMR